MIGQEETRTLAFGLLVTQTSEKTSPGEQLRISTKSRPSNIGRAMFGSLCGHNEP